jgi:hypothetical protein
VIEKWNGKPGTAAWLMMIRRSLVTDENEIKLYLSNAPEIISLDEMAWVGCRRWSIDVDFKLAKGEVGLDHTDWNHWTIRENPPGFSRI